MEIIIFCVVIGVLLLLTYRIGYREGYQKGYVKAVNTCRRAFKYYDLNN